MGDTAAPRWRGLWAGGDAIAGGRRATVMTTTMGFHLADATAPTAEVGPVRRYVYEPDGGSSVPAG